ncbi:AMP-binding protein [Adlercreutzia sp. ZJ138]|uniref:AMP-binding protein n=1 Tax=Adlercreutzia sp. ZJ138 TaxID=2709405 RepID=UPI0013EBFF56|nr:AMP-binding protein [Adlercreutzia sp. ZJ138]
MRDKDAVALVSIGEELTYGALEELAAGYASQMHRRALVFMKVANNIPSVAFYIGCLNHDIVPLMLNVDIAKTSWELLYEVYKPEYIWVPVEDELCVNPVFADRGYGLVRVADGSPTLGEDLGLLLSTSGSTGSPKLVRQSRANVLANAESIVEYLDIKPGDRAITTLPFGYTYDISIVNSHLLAGATVILNEYPLMDRRFWDLFKERGATTFGGVPYTYQMLDKLGFDRMNLPSLRYITQAGGRLGETLHRKFGEICVAKGIDFIPMYGQTEATARMSYLPKEKTLEKIGSIGVAIPGGRFSLLAADDSVIEEAGVDGELIYEGANVTLGYAVCVEDLAKGDERGGVLHTGDVARRDEDGFYYITGRLNRFLKVYGNRVGLDELESILSRSGVVAAATGDDDHVVVFVETGEIEGAKTILTKATGLNHVAFDVRLIDSIPRSTAGKIQYSELKKLI